MMKEPDVGNRLVSFVFYRTCFFCLRVIVATIRAAVILI